MTWISPMVLLGHEQDAIDFVHLDKLDLDALVAGGWQVLADVIRADRAAGVEDVVDEDAGHPLEWEVERRRAHERLRVPRRLAAANVDVVAVEGDVQLAEGDLGAGELRDPPAQPLRERDAARVDADERDLGEVGAALDDLVCDTRQRLGDRLSI